MDPFTSSHASELGPRPRTKKRKFFPRLFLLLTLVFLGVGGYVAYRYVFTPEQQAITASKSITEVPVVNMEKARVEKWNGVTKKVAYLTFEDGPSALTPDLLRTLDQLHTRATFFYLGPQIDAFPKEVKAAAKAGHYIGLHGETHDYDTLYEKGKYVSEMQSVQKKIHELTKLTPHLTRPPYGSDPGITKKMASAIHSADFRVWDWSIDSMDWYYKDSAKEVANTVIRRAERPFEIILLHEQPQAIKALPAIVDGLQKKGYQFAIYDEDFHTPYNFANHSNL